MAIEIILCFAKLIKLNYDKITAIKSFVVTFCLLENFVIRKFALTVCVRSAQRNWPNELYLLDILLFICSKTILKRGRILVGGSVW